MLRLLTRRGQRVQPFKVGPDYIDPGHHARACGVPSYNLDSFMCSPQYVKKLYGDVKSDRDLAVVEGVMGLFDGAHAKSAKGSTAEIARLLNLPVILLIDGRAMARSSAALVKGFSDFDRKLNFLGVVANRVNSPGHAEILRSAIEHYTSLKFLGHLPENPALKIPSRHLGLYQSHEQSEDLYERWADHIEKHVDLDFLKQILPGKKPGRRGISAKPVTRWMSQSIVSTFKVGIARDDAFQFIYPDTLDMFRQFGGQVQFFSPLKDRRLPSGLDWIYIPGGYPELHAKKLSSNRSMRSDLRDFGRSGKVIVGECGGLMYLGNSIMGENGKSHEMVGLFKFSTTLNPKKMTLGYRVLSFRPPLHPEKKLTLKGHEFHFSSLVSNKEIPRMIHQNPNHAPEVRDGYVFKNCLALYSHIYWGSSPAWLKFILNQTKRA
ncbi:MAG: cobyrinic acid a,c-diamide synthase [Nitrospinae bacterium CG11_big_fil_rev_8_21_14_0_20_56_8]|nr:MAG: cobyrinic acid a,c-diamide synthase [Nitrospinae bacterium CG11_big_fil_rev_8_21_14_0_20_56_8]